MTTNDVVTFKDSIQVLSDESVSPFMKVDHNAVEQYRKEKSEYQCWRKIVSDNTDDLRDFHRIAKESAEMEKEIKRLEEDLSVHRRVADEQKEKVAQSQTEADDLRGLADATKRLAEDANRIVDKKIEINTKNNDLSVNTGVPGTRDLRTVERDMNNRMKEKDDLSSKINKCNKEMTLLNNKIAHLSTKVSAGRLSYFVSTIPL
jgi:chromosome segregation ATPase